MAFSIKDPETDRIVRDLAKRAGLGLTDAVRMAAENELKRRGASPTASPEVQAAEFLAWMRRKTMAPTRASRAKRSRPRCMTSTACRADGH